MKFKGTLATDSADRDSIFFLKKRLNELLDCNLDVTNPNFGENTEARVKEFQRSRKLNPDGIVGELTWSKLFEVNKPIVVTSTTLITRALEIARTQLGVHEATGHNDGEAVESYLRSVGLGKGYAWCQAFVYWCYNQAAKELGVTNPLAKTAGVLNHWNTTKGKKVITPQTGDVFIMDFGKGLGHTGLVKEVRGGMIITIEGNTNDANSREGDGVYERIRSISSCKGFIRY